MADVDGDTLFGPGDWIAIFSHGTNRAAALCVPVSEPLFRFPRHLFISAVRTALLIPQLPHIGNAAPRPGLDYNAELCVYDRHDAGTLLGLRDRLLDPHGKHSRSNCPASREGIMHAHKLIKHALHHAAITAALHPTNEPTAATLLHAVSRDEFPKWFPASPSPVVTERAVKLVREKFAILDMPHTPLRVARQHAHDADAAVASISGAGHEAQLDKVVMDPVHPEFRPIWCDVASVLPAEGTEIRAAKLRMDFFLANPTAEVLPVELRTTPSLDEVVNFKVMKYKALVLAGRLQCKAGLRLGGVFLFIALVVSTLGQI